MRQFQEKKAINQGYLVSNIRLLNLHFFSNDTNESN
ncbi:Uncharacterised protein [Sphingobacterium multivorum]|uniref:Uncharacterized protein n=1 Tax=Sphingobacterium multivorum TaxID=28454 RepID=A0A2X2J9D0_SPHMU|nr:Uncharacterised protein [Sphingobacterium multivorum]